MMKESLLILVLSHKGQVYYKEAQCLRVFNASKNH